MTPKTRFETYDTRYMYTVHGRGAKHWFTPSQIIKSTPNRAPKSFNSSTFFIHAIHVKNPFSEFQKSSPKVHQTWSWLVQNRILAMSNPHWYVHFEHFFSFFSKLFKNFSKPKNRSFKTPRSSGTWSPLISSSQKVITFRTDERTYIPVLTVRTDVKSASRKNTRARSARNKIGFLGGYKSENPSKKGQKWSKILEIFWKK